MQNKERPKYRKQADRNISLGYDDTRYSQNSPLHIVPEERTLGIAQLLVASHSARVRYLIGVLPLHTACKIKGDPNIVNKLIETYPEDMMTQDIAKTLHCMLHLKSVPLTLLGYELRQVQRLRRSKSILKCPVIPTLQGIFQSEL
jgi:hypothetical protein